MITLFYFASLFLALITIKRFDYIDSIVWFSLSLSFFSVAVAIESGKLVLVNFL